MIVRPRRSALYVPGSNLRAMTKSRTLDADALIFDLEDAVAPADKAGARDAVLRVLAEGGFGRRERVVRVNALDTPWGRDDLAAAAEVGPDAILLPKVSAPGQVREAARILAGIGAAERVRLWAMVETPAALLGIAELARTAADASSRLDVLVMGTNDLAKDLRLRVKPGREPLLAWLATCVAAARCYGLDILDGVFNGLDDPAGLAAEARQGRDYGMDGKTCIHPGQIAACNDAFSPDDAELAWARRLVAAFDGPEGVGLNVLRIEGQMVERLHAEAARRLLAMERMVSERRMAGDPPPGALTR